MVIAFKLRLFPRILQRPPISNHGFFVATSVSLASDIQYSTSQGRKISVCHIPSHLFQRCCFNCIHSRLARQILSQVWFIDGITTWLNTFDYRFQRSQNFGLILSSLPLVSCQYHESWQFTRITYPRYRYTTSYNHRLEIRCVLVKNGIDSLLTTFYLLIHVFTGSNLGSVVNCQNISLKQHHQLMSIIPGAMNLQNTI